MGRLMYECFVGIITKDHICSGRWLVDASRDAGHVERIRRLVARVKS